jgi:protease IV
VALSRGARLVVVLLLIASAISFGGVIMIWLAVGREPAVPAQATLVLKIDGDPIEGGTDDTLGQYLPVQRARTVRTIVDAVRKAARDRRISAMVVRPSDLSSPYLAKVQEIRDAILEFKRSGKATVAFLETGGQTEYYLATACDRVFLLPSSPLQLTGTASYALFLRGTLDKIGAYPDMLHIGAYKTAMNQLTEKTFTPAHREMAESLNTDAYQQIVKAVAGGRKKSEADVRALVDQGPFLPEDALRAGLIDDVAYEDQVGDKAKVPLAPGRRIDLDEYARVSPASAGFGGGAKIAVIYASGTIVSGKSGYDPLNGAVVGSDTLVDYIRTVRDRKDIRAVVLRVDSPGGSAVASDVIWRELVRLRDAKPDKALVVSMSDLAASGGYYIAMAAPQIVAEPGTLTGSIGIFGGKIVTGGTYAKLGINIEGVSQGKFADMNSPTRPFNPDERAKLAEQLQGFYDQFVERVAASRHMTPERVDAIAQGRVWTGQQARQNGLVDTLGGLDRAVSLARQRAKIPEGDVELVVYPPRRSFFELLSAQLSGSGETLAITALLGRTDQRALSVAAAPLTLFRSGEPLALMPFGILR